MIFSCSRKTNENDHQLVDQKIGQMERFVGNTDHQYQNDFKFKLWQKGIDFYARGNEPSWALDMDFQDSFQFKTLDGIEIIVPPIKGTEAMDAKVIRYNAEVEAGTLIVTIQEEKCQDTMADEVFHFSVRIQVKSGTQQDFEEYSGCGNYVSDYRLHDIWVLENLNGMDLKSVMSIKDLPRFEFYASEGKILGNDGCNDFSGDYIQIGSNEIQFSEVSRTKKMCSDLEIENNLSKFVFGRRMNYSIENLKLKLTGFDGTKIIFKKID